MKSKQKLLGYWLLGIAILLGVILVFVKINLDNQAVFLCTAIEADPSKTMEECPVHTSTTPLLIMIAFGVAALILASGAYLVLSSSKIPHSDKQPSHPPVDISKLSEDEQRIYTLVKDKGGSLYQSDLISATGLSKVKITRILDKLEHTDQIIERKRRGMTNLVVLK